MRRVSAIRGAVMFAAMFTAATVAVWGQSAPEGRMTGGPHPMPAMERGRGMHAGPGGKWWDDPRMVKELGITADQQKKMDDIFQQSRLKLIDLNATLEKEEVMMDGFMQGPQLDDARILPAIDRIAQARAELEKANARFLLGIRHALTPEQWKKLEERPRPSMRSSRGQSPDAMQNRQGSRSGGMGPRPSPPQPPAPAGPPPQQQD